MKVVRLNEIEPIAVVLEHLAQSTANPRMREHARTDNDLDSLRDDPRFSAALESPPE